MANPKSAQIEFTVKWNRSLLNKTKTYGTEYFDTTENITALICDETTTNTANIPADSSFTNVEDSVTLDGIVGLSIDNTLLHNALMTNGDGTVVDALYNPETAPATDSPVYTDLCLHQIYNEWLVYRSMGVCMKDSTYTSVTTSPEMCVEEDDCADKNQMTEWALDHGFATAVAEEPLGIALDGHIIVGPYNEDGELYVCADLDGCNGTFLSDNSYAYVMSRKFPYIVGCWGSASPITTPVESTCSIDACVKSAVSGVVFASSALALVIAATSF